MRRNRLSIVTWLAVAPALSAAPVDRCDQIAGYELSPSISGNTVASFGNQYDLNACAGQPGASLLPASGQATEQVVKLQVASPCTATVTVVGGFSGANQSDPAVYAATTCPIADPGSTQFLDSSCLAAADATGGLGTEVISFAAQPGVDYFVYFDGFLAAQGPYTATLSGCTLTDPAADPVFANGFEG
ncbi:MAG: hypothetical protein IPK27_03100 [Rhodanobacteraceae bacterium]|nr:hypothetical protein [Rhodanobacteraceae bacterium]